MERGFSHIVGEIRQGEPATIRFYGKITEESATRFNGEFDWLESQRPSVIRVLINCEGGSVLHGMSSYATIQNSTVPTECVNEGMAASMGSVLWAAGGRSLMRDYAILMIHNPFLPSDDGEANEMVLAFCLYRNSRVNLAKFVYASNSWHNSAMMSPCRVFL